jgi:hypothetical protein
VPLDARCTADQEGGDGASTRDTQAAEEGESAREPTTHGGGRFRTAPLPPVGGF